MNTHLFYQAAELADDDRHDPRADDETPEPCRGCGQTDCGEQCAEFRAWLAVAYLAWDAAQQDEFIERANLAYDAWLHARDETDAASGGDADARP